MEPAYKISIVNYYNTTPFLFGIENSPVKHRLQMELDIPSVCATKLKNKEVDLGVVPVAILPQLDQYHIITDYCIGAVGKVDSVKLFAEQPLENLTHVMLDYQSRTSVTLVQVLNHYFWKKNIEFIPATPGFENRVEGTTGAVIIGDRTFGLTRYPYQYDLAYEWQKYTGMPFVFACWVSNRPLDPGFIEGFNDALAYGVNHIREAVAEKPNHTPGFDAFDYLQNKISYNLDSAKRKALDHFLDLLKDLK
ncbi:MAG: menaquinone biosynthesis protein [Bacteroidetes bacterium]|nr:menaquinone biosynthesis protein [Bacteroidota bacterium]